MRANLRYHNQVINSLKDIKAINQNIDSVSTPIFLPPFHIYLFIYLFVCPMSGECL